MSSPAPGPAGLADATPALLSKLVHPLSVKHNAGVASYISIALALIAGLSAGILGVEGWSGFLYYILSQAVSAAIIHAKAGGNPAAFSDSPTSLLIGDALGSSALLTFFLWWALSHNFCHLFG